jgi:RNA polymerase sigma factor (sigma-70 family)
VTHGSITPWNDKAPYAADEEKSPERVLVVEQELSLVAGALNRMPERTRDVFLLIRVEGLKQAEIAEMLGISVSAVEKHFAKALAHLGRYDTE